ncbi:MAG: DUF4445 domain-containing protein, partial [Alphaproteobacteria bacterium]|nr:DUF4445 domain-containing protein [Alphaproteobacteria bacterium]
MSGAKNPLVVFQPSGKRGRFAPGTPVLEAARSLGVYIESVCGGRGICGKCQISVAEGEFAKFGVVSDENNLSPIGAIEKRYADKRHLATGRRLSCTATIAGDLVVEVPDAFRVAGQTIRKDADTVGMVRAPAIRLCYVELDEPEMDNPLGDADRLCAAIERDFALKDVGLEFDLLQNLQARLRAADWKITAAVRTDGPHPLVVALFAGFGEELTGLAVDIGSTTIAAHLVDLTDGQILASSGMANPQIRFGEDLMSRVSYVMMNEAGLDRLITAVRGAVNDLIGDLLAKTGRDQATLLDAVVVANPVMHHIFFGLDPTGLGQAPFALAQSAPVNCAASEVDINLGVGGRIHALPLVAGHVGADAAAVILAQKPQSSPLPALVVDVGTNAEIILWDGKTLYAASSPTGPALEGAEISSGQRAAPGAIERIRIDRKTLEARFRVIGSEKWSTEAGFETETAKTGVTGICGSGIIEVIGEMVLAGILSADGIIRGPANDAEAQLLVAHGRTWSYLVHAGTQRLEITQTDVRAVQLAKAALYAGVKLLLDEAGLTEVADIRLAGAFGTYIDPAYAMLLGLVPDCKVAQVKGVGNAAGQGALIALLNGAARGEIADL